MKYTHSKPPARRFDGDQWQYKGKGKPGTGGKTVVSKPQKKSVRTM